MLRSRPWGVGLGPWLAAAGLLLLIGLSLLLWRSQSSGPSPLANSEAMASQLEALPHPQGTVRIKRIVGHGPIESEAECPPWLLAGESRLFSGVAEPILTFYTEPYQVVLISEMKPILPEDPFVILGHDPAAWGLKPDQYDRAYIVYHLLPSDCGEDREH